MYDFGRWEGDATKVRLLKALVWPVAVYGCESWTLRTADEKRIQAFEMRGLRQILRVPWTAKRTNDWVLDKAEVSRNLLESVKARKLTYFGHVMQSSSESLQKQIMQGTTSGSQKKRQTENNVDGQHLPMDRTADTHWTRSSRTQKTKSDGDNSCMVWPSLGARTAEGKSRQWL